MTQSENPTRSRSGIRDVCDRYQRTPQTIWTWYRDGNFPKPHYIAGVRYWFDDELDAYDDQQIQDYEERQKELADKGKTFPQGRRKL